MNFSGTVLLALKNIKTSKMRTFLTMLGIIIGVTAVILIVGLGNGIENYMTDSFNTIGTGSLTVMVTGRGSSRMVSVDEMYDIVDRHPECLAFVSPTVTVQGSVKVDTEKLGSTTATGVSEDYFEMKDYEIAEGRGLVYVDIAERKSVCVIGNYVNETYYNGRALGQTIRVGKEKFTIIGVMAQEADEPEKGGTDDCLYLPYSTAARLNGASHITTFAFNVTDEDLTSDAKDAIDDALYKIFRDDDAYAIISMTEILEMMNDMLDVVITVLAIIAGISLLVGGIGIMNIMLVSVTERTREIGIRKALGAKERTILAQFVVEAAVTSGLGGIVGIIAGYAFSRVATVLVSLILDTPLTVVPSTGSVLMAFGISAAVGVIFGYLPARKAARLNPIDALRYE